MHINYQLKTSTISVRCDIAQRLRQLEREEKTIVDTWTKLIEFVQKNALVSFNDDYLEYLQLYIGEERTKARRGENNQSALNELQLLYTRAKELLEWHRRIAQREQNGTPSIFNGSTTKEVFDLVDELCQLPINGSFIEEQINVLKRLQDDHRK